MPQARDEAGNIWETDADGNAVRLLQPASPAASAGQVFTLPESPKQIADRARQAAADARQAERDAKSDADRQADNARADRALALQEGKVNGSTEGGKAAENARAKLQAAKNLQRQLAEMRKIYDRSFKGAGPVQSAMEYLPTADAEAMRAIAKNMRADLKPLIRGPAEGTFTEGDQALLDQLIPDPKAFDSYNERLFTELENRINGTFEQFGGPNGQRADDELTKPVGASDDPGDLPPANEPGGNDPTPPTPWNQRGPDGQTIATGETRTVQKPEIASMAYSLLRSGAGYSTIKAALESKGGKLTMSDYAKAKKAVQSNPDVNPFYFEQQVPVTTMQSLAGSPLGAAAAQYANAATAGSVGALAGDEGKGALAAMSAVHPGYSVAGQIAGGVTGALGLESAAARFLAPRIAAYAPRIGDTAYGGIMGANSAEEGHGLTGAATGATAGLVGGYLGERAMGAIARGMRGITDPNVQYLRQQGIPLTVGQAVSQSGTIGAGVKKVEESLTGLPILGNQVEGRWREGLRGFNDQMFATGAAPGTQVTARGAEGAQQLQQGVQDAYRQALDPATIDTLSDPHMVADLAQAQLAAGRMQNPAPSFPRDFALGALENRIEGYTDPSGMMSGRNFQEAYRGLGRDRRGRAQGDSGHEIGDVLRQGQDLLGEALERQNPGAFEGFLEANAANRRLNVIADALKNAANQGEELVTPAQLNRADTTSTSRLEGKINSATGNRPFYDLATAGQAVLPSKLPDSGTSTRALIGYGLATGGLGAGAGAAVGGAEGAGIGGTSLGLGATLALALGGSRPAQAAATRILLDRPEWLGRAGEALARNSQIGGWTGAGVLTPLLVGP